MASRDFKNATVYIQDGSSPVNQLEVILGEGNLTYTERREVEYIRNRGVLNSAREGDEQPIEVSLDAEWEYTKGPAALTATAIDNVAGYNIGDTTISVDTMGTVPKPNRKFTIAGETGTPEHTVFSATATSITFTPALVSSVADDAVVTFTQPPTVEEAIKMIGNASSWTSTDPDQCNLACVDLVIEYDPGSCGDTETITLPYFRWEEVAHDLSEATLAFSGQCNVTLATAVRPSV